MGKKDKLKNEKKKKNNKINNEKLKSSKKKKSKIWLKVLIVVIIILAILGGWFAYKTKKNGGGVSGMLATVVGHDEETKKNLPELKVLLLGVSTDLGDNAPTDTIMVVSYNPKNQTANLLSVPRDTYVGRSKLKATPSDKINSLYSYGGAEKTLEAVNRLTGLDIQYYAVVKTEALIKLVDAIGEVDFNVPINMKYDDPTQNLHIDLKAGEQKINGDKAEQLLRFRKNNNNTTYPEEYGDNDTGRMRTQREFMMAVMQQTLKPGNIFKIGEILDIANKYLETNIDFSYIKDYIPYAVEFSTENLQTETIPGINKLLPEKAKQQWWFFEADEDETESLIQKLFYSEENTLEENTGGNSLDGNNAVGNKTSNQNSTNTNSVKVNNTTKTNSSTNTLATSSTTIKKLEKSDIQIEVLNGSGDTAKMEKAVELLKESGYDVTKTGKTTSISKTIITNKKELDSDTVKEIKNVLGVGSISNKKNLSSKVHVTIVIGKDFNQE